MWLPTPLAVAPYQKTLGDTYHIDAGTVSMVERETLDLLVAEWPDGAEPILTLTSRASMKPHAIDFTTPAVPPPKDFSGFGGYLRPLKPAPLDEDVLRSAIALVARGSGTDLDRARAIYEWVTETSRRDSSASSPNRSFVAIARSAGLPARGLYGLRLSSADATRAQADRAEVYLVGYGWVPLDAAERGFGSWDLPWVAYNDAHDVLLPGSARGALPFFMHPHGETGGQRVDSLNPEAFRYEIAVRETG